MPSNYVGARSIEELAAALTKLNYTPRTEQQRREQSENLYRNQLNQALLSAQQQYDTSDLALQNQLSGLERSTQRQIESQQRNTRQAISQADRRALSRGMQRSSYNNDTLANLQLKGDEAVANIEQARTDTENSVATQRALLAQQLAQNLTAAQSQYEGNVIASMQQMEDQDYQRGLAADQFNSNTQLQLYQAQQADAQRAQQQAQFDAGQALTREQMAQNQNQFDLNLQLNRDELAEKIRQFNEQMAFNREKLAGAGSGSGSSGSSNTPSTPRTTTNPPATTNTPDYTDTTQNGKNTAKVTPAPYVSQAVKNTIAAAQVNAAAAKLVAPSTHERILANTLNKYSSKISKALASSKKK